jgi:hypothetical protein
MKHEADDFLESTLGLRESSVAFLTAELFLGESLSNPHYNRPIMSSGVK